jgi:hypothetical protein
LSLPAHELFIIKAAAGWFKALSQLRRLHWLSIAKPTREGKKKKKPFRMQLRASAGQFITSK